MAKIVEFIGSPGVGKTTLYKELEAQWNNSYNWAPVRYFYPKKINFANAGTSVLNIIRGLKDGKRSVDIVAMEEAGQRFVEQYPEYINVCWRNISCIRKNNLNNADLRFQKVWYLYKLMQKIQVLTEYESDKIAVIDEGLVHMIPSILCKRETMMKEEESIEELLDIMPLPEGVIFVETDVQENIRRLLQRNKVIPMHRSLNYYQLESITRSDRSRRTVINSGLKSRNIPFLYLNSTDEIKNNVLKIKSFLKNL